MNNVLMIKESLLKRSSLLPIVEIAGKVLSFGVTVLLIRILSVKDYGIYSYVMSIVLLASVFMDGGINYLTFNKSIKNDFADVSLYYSSRLVISLISILALSLFSFLLIPDYLYFIFLFSIIVLFTSNNMFVKSLARGNGAFKIDVICIIFEPSIKVIVLSVLYLLSISLRLERIYYLFIVLGLIAFLYVYQLALRKFHLRISFSKVFKKLRVTIVTSKFFLLYYFAFIGLQRIDIFFINEFINVSSVALFSSSYTIYISIQLFFRSLITSKFKSLVETPMVQWTGKFKVYLFILAGCILSVLVSSKFLFSVLFPSNYTESYIFLNYFMIALPFYFVMSFGMYYLNYLEKTSLNFIILTAVLIAKFTILYIFKFESIDQYVTTLVVFEAILGLIYLFLIVKFLKKNVNYS